MKGLMVASVLLVFGTVWADEVSGPQAMLEQFRSALEAGRLSEAHRLVADVQALYYRQPETMAEALYCEVLLDQREGGPRADVSALAELQAFYPDSEWCRKAVEHVKRDAEE